MPDLNVFDLLVVTLVLISLVRGFRSGFAVQVGGFVGFLIGLVVGAWLAPRIAGAANNANASGVITLVTVFFVAFALGAGGQWVGVKAANGLDKLRLGRADEVVGAVFSAGFMVLVVWLVSASLASAPLVGLGAQIQGSYIVGVLDDILPPVPSVLSRLGRLADPLGVPRVFIGLQPPPASPVDPPDDAVVAAGAEIAKASTVQIFGRGCGGTLVGSGFVAGEGLVVTNAHVIAGLAEPRVRDSAGNHDARVVVFDPSVDLAVLAVDGLAGPPLVLAPGGLARGTGGAVLGYPNGGPLVVGAAAITAEYEAAGRDIYGSGRVDRNIYEIQSVVQPGNSGGPFVLADGTVGAVVFARSIGNDNVGYALTNDEVFPVLRQASVSAATINTGRCAAE